MKAEVFITKLNMRWIVLLALCVVLPAHATRKPRRSPDELRQDYLSRIAQAYVAPGVARTQGSLWSPNAVLADSSIDYKAHTVNDTLTVVVSVQTTAAQSGSVNNARNFSTNSAITGLLGGLPTTGTNPLFAASSSNALKGSGQTASNTTFTTSLTGQIIAVLPNGNMVVEAHRQIDMNNQHEEVIVRGITRPGDISPVNTVASTSLSSLEIELKGKGIISDSTRPPNPVTRAILWLFGF